MAGGDAAALEARVHRALSHVARVRIVHLLRDEPHTVSRLATATGLHPNTVRSHLDVLVEAGLVDRSPDQRRLPGRPSILYRLADPPQDGAAHEALARVLAAALREVTADPAGAAERAGRPWGRALVAGETVDSEEQAIERIVAELADIGFEPDVRTDGGTGDVQVLLRACPFDDLARAYGDVVCSAHLGLIRGALEELGASVVADLKPFVNPSLCLTQLTVVPRPEATA
jgi:predicted ArsR family transcriptional regulator